MSIRPQMVNLGLVRKNDSFPIRNGPILVLRGEFVACFDVTGQQKQFFWLDVCLQTSLSEGTFDGANASDLLAVLLKYFGNLGGVICLACKDLTCDPCF